MFPSSHNFITHDGKAPAEISKVARAEVENYDTVHFVDDIAVAGSRTNTGFEIQVASGQSYTANKLIFATGIKDASLNRELIFENF